MQQGHRKSWKFIVIQIQDIKKNHLYWLPYLILSYPPAYDDTILKKNSLVTSFSDDFW